MQNYTRKVRIDEEMVTKLVRQIITEDITNKDISLNHAIKDTVSKLGTNVDKENKKM